MGKQGRHAFSIKASVAIVGALAAVLAVAAACGGDGEEASPSPTGVGTPTPAPTPAFSFEGPVGIDLTTFGTFFEEGKPIQLAITVAVRDPMTLYYPTSQRYDLTAIDSEGAEVWRWSRERTFLQVTQAEELEANETLSFTEIWDQRDNDGQQVPPGDYQVVAESSHCDSDYENCSELTTSAAVQIRPSEEEP